jgi:2'-5' RNA ligase
VLAVRVGDESGEGSLGRLAERVERAAREHGFPPAERPFDAHVTLARARRGARVASPTVEHVGDLGAFIAEHLVLYRSDLDRGGSRYLEEASYTLAAEAP